MKVDVWMTKWFLQLVSQWCSSLLPLSQALESLYSRLVGNRAPGNKLILQSLGRWGRGERFSNGNTGHSGPQTGFVTPGTATRNAILSPIDLQIMMAKPGTAENQWSTRGMEQKQVDLLHMIEGHRLWARVSEPLISKAHEWVWVIYSNFSWQVRPGRETSWVVNPSIPTVTDRQTLLAATGKYQFSVLFSHNRNTHPPAVFSPGWNGIA